ncbi:hypothetical protein GBK04_28750 [Cytophagaceae bacterium SJW1-29]|uniref:Uncharacterized protein n=2 Tax=Salmonirosea aquatica TaxID=2654236 RepID=A0A7C9BGT7_9BACT|nr:hypothetical protein [Cytophagaceae bacterium SJW1-29]
MTAHCYPDSYAIGKRIIHEGYGLYRDGNQFVWFYTERGARDNLHYFQTESDAVAYVFAAITSDKTGNRHLIGLVTTTQEQVLLTELDARGVRYWKDEIPFGSLHDKRSRIFVFGCDIRRVPDLLEKYGIWQQGN